MIFCKVKSAAANGACPHEHEMLRFSLRLDGNYRRYFLRFHARRGKINICVNLEPAPRNSADSVQEVAATR